LTFDNKKARPAAGLSSILIFLTADLDRHNHAMPIAVHDAMLNRNREFHTAIVCACDSSWLMRLRDVLYSQQHSIQ
jgi:DNA-binding GntR family transcriptional regulator